MTQQDSDFSKWVFGSTTEDLVVAYAKLHEGSTKTMSKIMRRGIIRHELEARRVARESGATTEPVAAPKTLEEKLAAIKQAMEDNLTIENWDYIDGYDDALAAIRAILEG